MESTIAKEVQLLENFNLTKANLKHVFQATSSLTENDDAPNNSKILVENEIKQFLSKYPIHETEETKISFDRFIGNYPYLKLYKGLSLQGITVIDYVLSLPSSIEIASMILDMLAKLWDKDEKLDLWQDRIGYYGFIQNIHSMLSLFTANRNQSIVIQDLLSTHLYIFNVSDLTRKLQKEDTYKQQQQIDLNALNSRAGLLEHIMKFEIYSQKNENLLQHVFSYSMNMNRLISFKNPSDTDRTCLQEILEIDLFSLIGEIMFDESANVTLRDIESIVCNLNTNLLHVITKNTCPIISICDKFSTNPIDDFSAILQLIIKGSESSNEMGAGDSSEEARKLFKIKRHDILDYVRQHNELIAYFLEKMHGIEPNYDSNEPSKSELNYKLFENMMAMEEISIGIETSDDCDRMLAALNFDSLNLEFARDLIHQKKYR